MIAKVTNGSEHLYSNYFFDFDFQIKATHQHC